MRPAASLLIVSASALLLASRREAVGVVEAGDGDPVAVLGTFDGGAILDRAETLFNVITEEPAMTAPDTAAANVGAMLAAIRYAEGTARALDPYRVCYGYAYTVRDLRDHPAVTGEWLGERLPDAMCANAGFGPGCKSTAAGAYQIIRPTWVRLRDALGLADFSAASQDAAAVELIRQRGALQDVRAGRFAAAVSKCRNEWASLPGNYARQGQRSMDQLIAAYTAAGGNVA